MSAIGPDDEVDVPQAGIGWPRAIGSGLAALVVALGAAIGATNWIVTDLTGLSRDARVRLAAGLLLGVVVVVMWALRRLQARGLI